jgi:hypothetical protein
MDAAGRPAVVIDNGTGYFSSFCMLLSLCFSLSLCDFVSFFFSFLPYVLAKSYEDFRVAGFALFEVDCT